MGKFPVGRRVTEYGKKLMVSSYRNERAAG